MLRESSKLRLIATAVLLSLISGCGGAKSPKTEKSIGTGQKIDSQPANSGKSTVADSTENGQQNTEQMAQRMVGEWMGDAVIVDQKALQRFAETENTSADNPDAARRKKAIEKFVDSSVKLYKDMKHAMVFHKDGSCTRTSWGTGAYSDGKPQKCSWKITKANGNQADITITISGTAVPYVADFVNDNEFTLRFSEKLPHYSDFNRATAERYKRKASKPGN